MKICTIVDDLTYTSLSLEPDIQVCQLTKFNYRRKLTRIKPDFLLVESAWKGYKGKWKYGIADYPNHPRRNNSLLQNVVCYAKELGIPTVFWNREDGVHFDRFINSAWFFDYIFTVDANCISKYKYYLGDQRPIHTLMFAIQPRIHYFNGFNFLYNKANFVGSYSKHVHPGRRQWQNLFFQAASDCEFGVCVINRNSKRLSKNYVYPRYSGLKVMPAVSYLQTADIYKNFLVSLNVNTVDKSPTMVSRRLVEILACGGLAVSNPSNAIDQYFNPYCYTVSNYDEACQLFSRLKKGPDKEDLEMARAGAEYIRAHHTWRNRLQKIARTVGI